MLRHYSNVSTPRVIDSGISDSETSIEVVSTVGYPDVPFTISLARGTENEEACLVTEIPDSTHLTVTRGYDGTTAVSHVAGTLIEHTSIAADYREARIVRITEAVRDALAGDDLWEGRVIYNEDTNELEVRHAAALFQPLLPTGSITMFGGATAPAGWLLCNGQAVSRTTYARLFEVIGETFGAGDESTTFNVPDLRQRFPLGVAASGTGSLLGTTGGNIDHVHTGPSHTHELPNHVHPGPSHNHSLPNHVHTTPNIGSTNLAHTHAGPSHTHSTPTHNHGGVTGSRDPGNTHSGGSHSHSASTGGPGTAVGRAAGSSNTASSIHSHSVSVSSGGSHAHSMPTHDHSIPTADSQTTGSAAGTTGSALGNHTHSIGNTGNPTTNPNTGTDGDGNTGNPTTNPNTSASGTGNTGTGNPPFVALHYIVRA